MQAKHEHRKYKNDATIWVGKYKNLTNLPHWHYDHEIVYVEKGSALIHIGNQTYTVLKGQSIFIQSQNVHYIQADLDSILILFIFAHKPLQKITGNFQLICPMLVNDYFLPELYYKLTDDINSFKHLSAASANNRVERLIIDIFMNENITSLNKKMGDNENNFRQLLDDIDKNFANYTLSDAAVFMSTSESHFSKLFKKMADTTFTRYLNMVRVEKAIKMMQEGNITITETAISCGFGSIRNFNRVFKDITGYSPRELPKDYNPFSVHPTYTSNNKEEFDPTDISSELL